MVKGIALFRERLSFVGSARWSASSKKYPRGCYGECSSTLWGLLFSVKPFGKNRRFGNQTENLLTKLESCAGSHSSRFPQFPQFPQFPKFPVGIRGPSTLCRV